MIRYKQCARVSEKVSDEDDKRHSDSQALKGQYANHFRIGHNAFEFIIDFGQFYEGNSEAQFNFRTITSPAYAVELRNMLTESIEEFEATFGKINELYDES